ncbi:MAG: porin family protein, partial [Gammaproteobacteria bacterium]|nr:porin family protein [Gammaproteobacteria bacterium]
SADASFGFLNRLDDDNSSFKLGAGYAFTPNIALEVAYQEFGSHDGETDCPPGFACLVIPVAARADVTGISLAVVGSLPLSDKFSAYGKIGLISWDVEFEGFSSAFDTSGEDLLYGAGLKLSLNDSWKLFAEYEQTDLDLGTAEIGVSFHF